jgi:aspartyl-tRNA(Asn)/glutamyl-tRNA(Gln) amidotransferase subunit A
VGVVETVGAVAELTAASSDGITSSPLGPSREAAKGRREMTSAIDLPALTIARIAHLIRAGELSPVDLTEAYLSRIERLDPLIGAYITMTAERARADASRAAAELADGRDRGPLHGVPIALKDLFDTAGLRTTGGAKFMADRVPERDSTVARKLAEAGAVLLGKLNTHELALGVTTNNPHFGPTRNPWDLAAIPGGSSGGSAAATAASLAAGKFGNDNGGSIRIPASLCGVVGLKPTYGRVSGAGVLHLSWTFDHTGPLTRTVEDAALLLGAIAGDDPGDPATVPVPVDDYTAGLGRGVDGLRVGVPRPFFTSGSTTRFGRQWSGPWRSCAGWERRSRRLTWAGTRRGATRAR